MLVATRYLLLMLALISANAYSDAVVKHDSAGSKVTIQQAMPQKQTQNMLLLMEVMRSNMTQLSDMMESHRMLSQNHLTQAARVMQGFSSNMQAISQRMIRGRFDDRSVARISKKNQDMINMMQKLQSQLESGRQ